MYKVAMTGASGAMGKETLKYVLTDPDIKLLRVLSLDTAKDRRFFRKMKSKYGERLEVFFGDVRSYEDCLRLTAGADYVLHLAAVIPPKADHNEELTVTTNFDGTVNMVNSVIENGNSAKYIHISTVAVYGNRNELHPWGRVGDPLLTSAYDVYGTSKLRAERYVLESDLRCWAVLRQTGILYDNMLMNNISDGLMFHTPWDVPIEWVTAKDSGILMRNILQADRKGACDDFWKRVYNIGDGQAARQTGYETFDDGFKLIGGSVKAFFSPDWEAKRNFHCFWFSDSDVLEEMFSFRTQGCEDFWAWFASRHKIYAVAKILPAKFLRKLVIEPLLKNDNAPAYWVKHGDEGRVTAIYGGTEEAKALSKDWADYDLLCERPDYEQKKIYDRSFDLDHGYDENKPDKEIDLDDLRAAATFRGGECLTEEMQKGDLYTKVKWRCHDGHEFFSSPYTVLKAGHWCPCCMPDREWKFDLLAKKIPFFAQVWYDSHDKGENFIYRIQDGKSSYERVEE
ncbi:MAG: NAD-dependent epimerase/dehydratase family protein [Clostridia bacterium]|nr:NAD-dependent epimerase/dehydratase family protein [Clostridia bacterium]